MSMTVPIETLPDGVIAIRCVEVMVGITSPVELADGLPESTQVPLDLVDEASMESFPCSDPPGYTTSHS